MTWNFTPMFTALAESERIGREVDLSEVTPEMIMRHFPECDPYRGSSGEDLRVKGRAGWRKFPGQPAPNEEIDRLAEIAETRTLTPDELQRFDELLGP